MKVALNPINTNTKSNNSNQVNFKARAELRLSEAFFTELGKLKPEVAATQIQNIIDAATFLKRVAPKIGKKDELVTLTEHFNGDNRGVALFYYRRFGINTMRESEPGKRLYYKAHITPVSVDDGSKPATQITDTINNKHNTKKGIVLKDGKKLPMPTEPITYYGGFIASEDGATLTRGKYTFAHMSAAKLAKRDTAPKFLGSKTTTLAELIAKLKSLCTPVEKQKKLAYCGWDK